LVLCDDCHCGIRSLIRVIHHTGTVIREEIGLSLDKADAEVLGTAAKVVITKDSTTIVGDGSTQEEVTKRVTQIKNQIEVCILELNILRFHILVVE
jgi:chaperonin GroEL (HSP60 family)